MEQNDLPREAQTGPIFHPDWGTHAYASWNATITGLDALLAMVFPMLSETAKSERYLRARRLKVENDFSGPWSIDVSHTMLSWQVAMRVSAVEVYLQDALTFLAVYDPEFIRRRGSKQEWDYDAVRVASDNEDVVWSFCHRWARSFIGDGGPARWAKALKSAGLGAVEAADVAALEAMWGYRHMRVHNAGRLSREFVDRHPGVAERLARSGLELQQVEEWSKTAQTFVATVEAGVSRRLRARLGEDLIEAREQAELERQMAIWDERHKRITTQETPEETEARVARNIAAAEERFSLMDELFHSEDSDIPEEDSGSTEALGEQPGRWVTE